MRSISMRIVCYIYYVLTTMDDDQQIVENWKLQRTYVIHFQGETKFQHDKQKQYSKVII